MMPNDPFNTYELWYTPFYKTKYMYIIYIILGLLILFIFYKFYILLSNKPEKKASRALKKLSKTVKTTSLSAKDIYFQFTNILKKYVIEKYNIKETGITDIEMLKLFDTKFLGTKILHTDLLGLLNKSIYNSQEIKFSTLSPLQTNINKDIDMALGVIKQSCK